MAPAEGVDPVPQIDTDESMVTVSDIIEIANAPDGRRFARLRLTYFTD